MYFFLFLLFKTWEILYKIQIPSSSKKEKYWPVSHCLPVSPSPKGQQAFRTERRLPMSRGLSYKPLYHGPHHALLSLQHSGQGLLSLITEEVKSLSRARLFVIPWTVACTRLLHPWDFLGKSTGVGCRFLLQGIFPTQGSNPGPPAL